MRWPVLRLNPQLTQMTAPGCIAPPHDGQRNPASAAGAAAAARPPPPFFAGGADSALWAKSCESSGLPSNDDPAAAGAAAGACAGILIVAPHLHLALLPASSGFHENWRPQEGQENFA